MGRNVKKDGAPPGRHRGRAAGHRARGRPVQRPSDWSGEVQAAFRGTRRQMAGNRGRRHDGGQRRGRHGRARLGQPAGERGGTGRDGCGFVGRNVRGRDCACWLRAKARWPAARTRASGLSGEGREERVTGAAGVVAGRAATAGPQVQGAACAMAAGAVIDAAGRAARMSASETGGMSEAFSTSASVAESGFASTGVATGSTGTGASTGAAIAPAAGNRSAESVSAKASSVASRASPAVAPWRRGERR